MRSRASRLRLLLVALATLATGGCTSYLVDEGDPAAPILVQGRVVDASGGGMSGATVELQADAEMDTDAGEATALMELGSFRAGLDGFFVVRLAPSAELTARADKNGGAVLFTLVAFEGPTFAFPFSRELRNGTWVGEIPTVEFTPNGVTGGGTTRAPALAGS